MTSTIPSASSSATSEPRRTFRDDVDAVLRASVDLGVPALAPVAADLRDRHPGDAVRLEGVSLTRRAGAA